MSLFGNLNPQNNQQQQQQQQPSAAGSLFGSTFNANNNTQNKPSLFGGSTAANATQTQSQPSTSLFGSSFGQPQQAQQQQPQQQQANNTFGQSFQNNQQQQQQPQQQPQQQQNSMFGNFGSSLSQNNANSFGASFLGASTAQMQQTAQQSRLGLNPAALMPSRDKTIPEQMETILRKWSPESQECLMQHYFYVSVPPEKAPFVTMPADADERKWEEALRNKPTEGSVPVIAKGFQQLGMRLQMQVEAVRQLQMRLHEMNNSLGAMMQNHELVLSVRAAEAKRKHIGLSQRCLALAIKAQVLGSRGFVLSGEEEELKKRLAVLEKGVFDPGFAGREEEIWARMVALRERTRWLQEESEKLGRQTTGENGGLDEEILKKTKKILSDYDAQLTHLRKELTAVSQEYSEWEATSRQSS